MAKIQPERGKFLPYGLPMSRSRFGSRASLATGYGTLAAQHAPPRRDEGPVPACHEQPLSLRPLERLNPQPIAIDHEGDPPVPQTWPPPMARARQSSL
jgi:hypothetical protein